VLFQAPIYEHRCLAQAPLHRTLLAEPIALRSSASLFAGQRSTNYAERANYEDPITCCLIITAVACATSLAQDKTGLQANASGAGIPQGSAGKSVELHLRSGEKMGGKVAQVTDKLVHLSNLTSAEYFDAFIDMKDVSAVIVRVAGK
jgi:hypothetical protein